MSFLDYFIGASQSKYASIAIMATILILCLAVLLTNTDIPFGQRLTGILFIVLVSAFPLLISLFELTCIVTGGKGQKYNLCHYYAWFVTILVIIYCFIIILSTLTSLFTYQKAMYKINEHEQTNKISHDDANKIANNMISHNEQKVVAPSVSHVASTGPTVDSPKPEAKPVAVVEKKESTNSFFGEYDPSPQYAELNDLPVAKPVQKVEKFVPASESDSSPTPFENATEFSEF